MINAMTFLPKLLSDFKQKNKLGFGHQISLRNGILYCKDIHPMLLESFPTSLGCIRMFGRTSDRISSPLIIVTEYFVQKLPSNFKQIHLVGAPN